MQNNVSRIFGLGNVPLGWSVLIVSASWVDGLVMRCSLAVWGGIRGHCVADDFIVAAPSFEQDLRLPDVREADGV